LIFNFNDDARLYYTPLIKHLSYKNKGIFIQKIFGGKRLYLKLIVPKFHLFHQANFRELIGSLFSVII